MFATITEVKSKRKTYQYLRIVENSRENGRVRQHVLANLGRLDQLEGKLGPLLASLARHTKADVCSVGDLRAELALPWGPVLLARHLYDHVGLGKILRRACHDTRSRRQFDVCETAFVLIANRLCDPRSEHGLARWLENTYVCDAAGKRWEPAWLPESEITKEQRVRVQSQQLNQWYRTLDALLAGQQAIEAALFWQVRTLFEANVDMVLYDVTSTYFERRAPVGTLRRHGHSRDGRPRNVQVVLGVVLANGFPIAHHVFPGNTADRKTLQETVRDLETRFGLQRVLIVGDRGFVSEENLTFLTAPGRAMRYLVGIPGRRCEESASVLDRLDEEAWERVDASNRVQEVSGTSPGLRYLVVESQERKAYEEAQRQRSMERATEELAKVQVAVEAGRLKDPAKIGARAQRALSRNHGHRYYSYDVPGPGLFSFQEDPAKMTAEQRREGRYILKTNDDTITPLESVGLYKQLSDVEWAYRDLKDVIRMRPIYHRSEDRIKAHLFVATLALFLKRALEHRLEAAGVSLTPTEAFAAMRSMGVTTLDVAGQTKQLVSSGGRDARRVLKALGIRTLAPPDAP